MLHSFRAIGGVRMHQFCRLIKYSLCLLLTMLLPSPPASDESCGHDYPYNAINQRACVFFHPLNNIHTQRNELIRLSDFLAGQTLFSHYTSLFVTFWNHDISDSMLDEARNIESFCSQKAYGQA